MTHIEVLSAKEGTAGFLSPGTFMVVGECESNITGCRSNFYARPARSMYSRRGVLEKGIALYARHTAVSAATPDWLGLCWCATEGRGIPAKSSFNFVYCSLRLPICGGGVRMAGADETGFLLRSVTEAR